MLLCCLLYKFYLHRMSLFLCIRIFYVHKLGVYKPKKRWYNKIATQFNKQNAMGKLSLFIGDTIPFFVFAILNLVKTQIPLGEYGSFPCFVENCVATIGVCVFRCVDFGWRTFCFLSKVKGFRERRYGGKDNRTRFKSAFGIYNYGSICKFC